MSISWSGFITIQKDSNVANVLSGDNITGIKPGSIIQVGNYAPKMVLATLTDVTPTCIIFNQPWLSDTVVNIDATVIYSPKANDESVSNFLGYTKSLERYAELNNKHLASFALSTTPTVTFEDPTIGNIEGIVPIGYVKQQYVDATDNFKRDLLNLSKSTFDRMLRRYIEWELQPYHRLRYTYTVKHFKELNELGMFNAVSIPNLNQINNAHWYNDNESTLVIEVDVRRLNTSDILVYIDLDEPLTLIKGDNDTFTLRVNDNALQSIIAPITNSDHLRIVISYKLNNLVIAINGLAFDRYNRRFGPIQSIDLHNGVTSLDVYAKHTTNITAFSAL